MEQENFDTDISKQDIEEEFSDNPAEDTDQPIATSFGTVTARLSEIAETMEDSELSLDSALDLLEEAVSLGMQASTLLESDMNSRNAEVDDEQQQADDELLGEGTLEDRIAEGSGNESSQEGGAYAIDQGLEVQETVAPQDTSASSSEMPTAVDSEQP